MVDRVHQHYSITIIVYLTEIPFSRYKRNSFNFTDDIVEFHRFLFYILIITYIGHQIIKQTDEKKIIKRKKRTIKLIIWIIY